MAPRSAHTLKYFELQARGPSVTSTRVGPGVARLEVETVAYGIDPYPCAFAISRSRTPTMERAETVLQSCQWVFVERNPRTQEETKMIVRSYLSSFA